MQCKKTEYSGRREGTKEENRNNERIVLQNDLLNFHFQQKREDPAQYRTNKVNQYYMLTLQHLKNMWDKKQGMHTY